VAHQPGEVVPFPIPGSAPARGRWLGLTPATIEVDWHLAERYGMCVVVTPRSPASRAGLKTGDFVKSINDKDYAAFHAEMPPTGSPFQIVFFRRGLGECRVLGKMGSPATPARVPAWRRLPAVLPGRRLHRDNRLEYHGFVARHPHLTAVETRLLTLLIEHDWHKGIVPKHATLASEMGCSIRTVKRSLCRCKHFGLLDWVSGKGDTRGQLLYGVVAGRAPPEAQVGRSR
jgi:hypothetical protein